MIQKALNASPGFQGRSRRFTPLHRSDLQSFVTPRRNKAGVVSKSARGRSGSQDELYSEDDRLRQRKEHQRRQEEKKNPAGLRVRRRLRGDGTLPLGAVAERRVAAGDADRVQPAGAELLVAGGGDEAGPGGSAGLPIMDPIGFDQHLLLAHVLYVDGAVDDVLRRGAVIVLHLLALVALDLKGISCVEKDSE